MHIKKLFLFSRRQNIAIELEELTCEPQNAPGKSYRFLKLLRRNTMSGASSGLHRHADMPTIQSDIAEVDDDQEVVVYQVGLNSEDNIQTTLF
jgi:hypothetical protein